MTMNLVKTNKGKQMASKYTPSKNQVLRIDGGIATPKPKAAVIKPVAEQKMNIGTAKRIALTEAKRNATGANARALSLAKQSNAKATKEAAKRVKKLT